MSFDQINKFILEFPGVSSSQPFGEDKLVYSHNAAMFALIDSGKLPLRLSLRCDPKLASVLRQKYDEVMPGDHLDAANWNTLVLAGQLSAADVKDLIRHAYHLVGSGTVTKTDLQ